uniref:Granulins domain-containing protein n=2 Tax=Electrophorus electricus TaxID=8005 RepID=A0A4W4H4Q7_ELEEL
MHTGNIRCSSYFYCPAANTCCKTLTGQWGCCPYILGQCCKDGKHCCERGYECDVTFSSCKKKGFLSIPAQLKRKALLL